MRSHSAIGAAELDPSNHGGSYRSKRSERLELKLELFVNTSSNFNLQLERFFSSSTGMRGTWNCLPVPVPTWKGFTFRNCLSNHSKTNYSKTKLTVTFRTDFRTWRIIELICPFKWTILQSLSLDIKLQSAEIKDFVIY